MTRALISFIIFAVLILATLLFGAEDAGLSLGFSSLVLVIAAFGLLLLGAGPAPAWDRPLMAGGGVLVLLAVIEAAKPYGWQAAGPEFAVMAAAAALYALGRRLGMVTKDAESVWRLVSLSFLGIAVVAFFDFVTDPDAIFGRAKAYHQGRLTAAFLSANTAATFFAMASVLGLGGLLKALSRSTEKHSRAFDAVAQYGVLPLVVFLFSFTCLLLTGSRGGILACAAGAGALIFLSRRGLGARLTSPPVIAVGVVIFCIVAFQSGGLMQERLTGLQADGSGRAPLWAASFAAWRDAPLFGHGFGRFAEAIAPHIAADTAPFLVLQGAAHNIVLQWLVQTGAVGVLVSAAVVALWLRHILSGTKRRQRMLSPLRIALGLFVVVAVHGMLDYALEIPAIVWWLAFIFGLASGIADGSSRSSRKERRSSTTP